MPLNTNELHLLVHLLDRTEPYELDCEQVLHRVAGLVERLVPGQPPPVGYEDVLQHLSICAECHEEFEALRRALADELSVPGDGSECATSSPSQSDAREE